MNGWVRVPRELLDHALWRGERFTRGQAAIDLKLCAAWKSHEVILGNRVMTVHEGEILTSQVELSRRWGWGRERVSSFLSLLQRRRLIDFQTSRGTDTGYTLITIININTFPCSDEQGSDIAPGIEADTSTSSAPDSVPSSVPDSVPSIDPTSTRHRPGNLKEGREGKEHTRRVRAGSNGQAARALANTYAGLFKAKFGSSPGTTGRDLRTCADLLKTHSPEELERLLTGWLGSNGGTRWSRESVAWSMLAFRSQLPTLVAMHARGDL